MGFEWIVILKKNKMRHKAVTARKTYPLEFDFRKGSVLRADRYTFHGVEGRVGTINNLSEYRVLSVEVGLFSIRNEKLGLVRVRARIGHGDDAARVELRAVR